jgi:hypothetical protein
MKPAVAALRGKLTEMEKSLSAGERQLEQQRLTVEQQRADVMSMRRSIALLDQDTGSPAPSPNREPVIDLLFIPTATNGHGDTSAKMDGHILSLVKASGRPLAAINIRDALLKQNVPGANMLLGSTHLYNVLNRLTKRGYLLKDEEGYRFGVEPPPRDPVNWERCATILTETGRPLTFADIARLVNERWGLDWGAIQAKWAIKDRKQIFELIHQASGLWGLREWPEPLKAAYRRQGPKRRARIRRA